MHPLARLAWLAPLAALFLPGCPATTPPSDARTDAADVPTDTPSLDAPDAAPSDAAPSDALDARSAAPCTTTVPVEDLAMLASPLDGGAGLLLMGATPTDYVDWHDAVQPDTSCGFRLVNERLFLYTMRTTAALRVSTNNPGSDAAFDSAVFVIAAPCVHPTPTLACNDDDPFAPRTPHVTLSNATTGVLAAGTQVLVAVGGFYPGFGSGQARNEMGETGSFVMTVRELVPVAVDAQCDPSGRDTVCPLDTSCTVEAIGSERYVCRRNGASAGSLCRAGNQCDAPLACDTSANRCYRTVGTGAGCDRVDFQRERCGMGSTCLASLRGAARGTCLPDGSAPGTPCLSNLCTADGLICTGDGDARVCQRLAKPGGPCNTADTACVTGQSCVPLVPGALAGRCVRTGSVAGAPCRADVIECDGDLACISTFSGRTCRNVGRTPGALCGAPLSVCSLDTECVPLDPSDPYHGACAPAGTLGGVCTASPAVACGPGLDCTNPAMRAQGRCVVRAALGAPCDLAARRALCPAGASCVRDPSAPQGTLYAGACRASGTVAGAACRASAPSCDAGLSCASSAGVPRICQATAGEGEVCEPRLLSVTCGTDGTLVCRATSLAVGTCARAVPEPSEPNDAEPAPAAALVTVPAAVQGSLTRYDVDCVAVDVPAGGALFAQATAPSGACTDNLGLDLYDPTGAALGTDTDSGPFSCPRIEGRDIANFPYASNLPAGRYTVCVREANDRRPVGQYLLAVDATAP